MHAPLNGVGTTPVTLILAIPSRRIHPSIIPRQLEAVCCVICRLSIISWITSPFLPYPLTLICALYYHRFYSSTTSPPLRSLTPIPNHILSIWGSTEPLEHSSGRLKGYFQYPTSYSAKTQCHVVVSFELDATKMEVPSPHWRRELRAGWFANSFKHTSSSMYFLREEKRAKSTKFTTIPTTSPWL